MTNVDTGEDTPVDLFDSVLCAIEAALPLLRNSIARGEAPDGGLSATILGVKALAQVCSSCIESDNEALLAALHDGDDHAG